jgi:hypothetical protein
MQRQRLIPLTVLSIFFLPLGIMKHVPFRNVEGDSAPAPDHD